ETVLETLEQVRNRDAEPPRRRNPSVDRDLETICLKCLHKEPQRRYASALALAEDLDRFLAGDPIRARPVTMWERGWKWVRRRPVVVAAVVLVLAVLALGGAALWREQRQRAAVEGAVEANLERAELLQQQERWDEALALLVVSEGQVEGHWLGTLAERIEGQKGDVGMLRRRERARLQEAAGGNRTGFDSAGAESLYTEAFTSYGLDLAALSPEDAAERVRKSAIRT